MAKLVAVLMLVCALVSLNAEAQGLGPNDQLALDLLASGDANGAVINRDGVCALLPGFGGVAFGGLFPEDCKNSFERVNKDGTRDRHATGVGGFFLIVFSPEFRIFGSEGSYAHWTWIDKGEGSEIGILTANGTLSDGSRFRLHFTNTPGEGDSSREGFLWVEGLGYVVGDRGND